jgi:hypothetical protein
VDIPFARSEVINQGTALHWETRETAKNLRDNRCMDDQALSKVLVVSYKRKPKSSFSNITEKYNLHALVWGRRTDTHRATFRSDLSPVVSRSWSSIEQRLHNAFYPHRLFEGPVVSHTDAHRSLRLFTARMTHIFGCDSRHLRAHRQVHRWHYTAILALCRYWP